MQHDCAICGIVFTPKRTDRIRCCSRKCGFIFSGIIRRLKRTSGRISCKTVHNRCVVCNKSFHSKRRIHCCSTDCERQRLNTKRREACKTTHISAMFSCKECGKDHIPAYADKRRIYCSNRCANKYERRISRKRDRAKQHHVETQRVDPMEVLRRDDWTCKMCGKDTPAKYRGMYCHNAPEMDHIIPLSKGGEHSYENTQCLCRRCNAFKSDRVIDQNKPLYVG